MLVWKKDGNMNTIHIHVLLRHASHGHTSIGSSSRTCADDRRSRSTTANGGASGVHGESRGPQIRRHKERLLLILVLRKNMLLMQGTGIGI